MLVNLPYTHLVYVFGFKYGRLTYLHRYFCTRTQDTHFQVISLRYFLYFNVYLNYPMYSYYYSVFQDTIRIPYVTSYLVYHSFIIYVNFLFKIYLYTKYMGTSVLY